MKLFTTISLLTLLPFQYLWAQVTTVNYSENAGVIANPERGVWTYNSNNYGSQGVPSPLTSSLNWLSTNRDKFGLTLCSPTYSLSPYKTQPIAQSLIDLMDADFATARKNGYKLLPHFNYCSRPGQDAGAKWQAKHLAQLKPLFQKNADVICAGQWGMYGFWGEQWGTPNTGDDSRLMDANDSTRIIFTAMLDATPKDRMFQMRYTRVMRQLMGNNPCSDAEGFTGTTSVSRVGHYNDCFLQEGNAQFNNDEGPWTYTSIQGQYTCDFAVADPNCGTVTTIKEVYENLDKQHFDMIDPSIGALVGNLLETDPLVMDIYKKIGYRYRLIQSRVSTSAVKGSIFTMNIDITNDGFGGIFNARKIEVILRSKSNGTIHTFDISGDEVGNRKYFPYSHQTKTWTLSVAIPSTMPAGMYEVLLNFPDPYPSIHDNPRYSIQLANQNIWESATGYNALQATVRIDNITGVENFPKFLNVRVHPNPVKEQVFISGELSENTIYEITSMEGKTLQAGMVGEGIISIQNIKSGLYIIKIKTGENQLVQRFVKE